MKYLRKVLSFARVCRACGEMFTGESCKQTQACLKLQFDPTLDLIRPIESLAVFDGSNPLFFKSSKHFVCANSRSHHDKLRQLGAGWVPAEIPGADSEPWQNIFLGEQCPLCGAEKSQRSTLFYEYVGNDGLMFFPRDKERESDDEDGPALADILDYEFQKDGARNEDHNEK